MYGEYNQFKSIKKCFHCQMEHVVYNITPGPIRPEHSISVSDSHEDYIMRPIVSPSVVTYSFSIVYFCRGTDGYKQHAMHAHRGLQHPKQEQHFMTIIADYVIIVALQHTLSRRHRRAST